MTKHTKELIDYEERLNRVTSFIYDHLDDDIDLDRLAAVACLSPFHWHRVYHALHGETLAVTVKRLRLHRAAGFLAQTAMPIGEIATRSRYASVSSFTRAFSEAYGMPPAEYRQNGTHARFRASAAEASPEAFGLAIKTVPAVAAVGVDHVGYYMQIGRAFDQLYAWLGARALLRPGMRSLAVYFDDPFAVDEERLRSRACVVDAEPCVLEPPLRSTEIRGGRYAVLRHQGPYATMRAAYQWLYGTWLPRSGEEAADAPIFEEYLNSPRDTAPADLLTDICLPLA